ncbi:MAG TPA: hypothetical protein VHX86_18170 [Tepidisphaeraceae bacterium]|jgi:hypothetical protein|nr:hypothetical protein [Tepidisphaeraceae bacterium]
MRRFAVVGDQPKSIEQSLLDTLSEYALVPTDDGVPPEVEYGWCGGRHILDNRFDFERNVFNDAVSFALRVDTSRVPAELRQAYKMMEEDAVAASNPSGFISRKQKSAVKETLARKLDGELRSGKFRRSRLTPILWDFPTATIYSPASGPTAEKLMELFQRSVGLELHPLSAGSIGLKKLESRAHRRDYEDLRPTRFVLGDGGEGQYPEYPWTAKGPQPKDFLGNEFLLWLWHEADQRDGTIETDSGDAAIFIDKLLDLDCAYGITGRDSLHGDGASRMPEARDALRTGKLPRKAGLILDFSNQQFNFTFNAESFSVTSAKLPNVEEADTPRTLFEERVALMRDLWKGIDSLFAAFLKRRCSTAWESQTTAIRKWILQSPKPVAAVA